MSYYVLSSYSEFLNLRCTCISTWSSRRQVQVQVRVPRAKYEYKYKYSPFKYKYEYKYSGFVLEYNSSTSTSTKYYISVHHCNNIDYKARNFPRKKSEKFRKMDKVLKFRNFYIGWELQIAITVIKFSPFCRAHQSAVVRFHFLSRIFNVFARGRLRFTATASK